MTKATISLVLLLTLGSSTSQSADFVIPEYMEKAAHTFDIELSLLYAICVRESKCNPKAINHDDATSLRKAMGKKEKSYGMFQIKVGTARGLGFTGKPKELLNPETNAWYAAKLLNHLYNRYAEISKVISAYNAGKYTSRNRSYVKAVINKYKQFKSSGRFVCQAGH